MEEISKVNARAELEYQDRFNKFLTDRGIDEEQFNQIIVDIINDRYDKDMRRLEKINNRYK